jgi:hypothetical protein
MRLLLAAVFLFALPGMSAAQDYRNSILYVAAADSTTAPSLAYVPSTIDVPKQPSIVFPILGGAAGGIAGMYGGVIVGASIEEGPADDITPGMVYGLLAGEMLLLPVGVHLGNGRKGSFLADLAVSAVIGTTAVFITSSTDDATPLLIGAAAQYAAVVAVERMTAKNRLEARSILERPQPEQTGPPPPDSSVVEPQTLHAPPGPVVEQPSIAFPVVLGVGAAVAGGYYGAKLTDDENGGEDDYSAVVGFLLGETLMLPVGVHFGNSFNGSLLGDLAVSMGGQAIALALATLGPVGYGAGIAGQMAFTVWNERSIGAKRLTKAAQAHAP